MYTKEFLSHEDLGNGMTHVLRLLDASSLGRNRQIYAGDLEACVGLLTAYVYAFAGNRGDLIYTLSCNPKDFGYVRLSVEVGGYEFCIFDQFLSDDKKERTGMHYSLSHHLQKTRCKK
jgi:hypothetical protein